MDLVANNVTLAYEDVDVVHNLNCVIPPRQITTFIGPNGSGTVSYTHLTLPTIYSV